MKASELRIGNSIMQDDDLVFVTWWRLELMENNKIEYKPIPLTEEWLLKLGFSMDDEYLSMWINDYKYCFKYRDWAKNWAFYIEYTDSPHPKDENQKYPVSFDIRYVNQLQNLYFALTGEELEIKDEVY
jgi:hypothetical protein